MATQNDMKPHESTYGGFIGMLKYGIVVVIIIAIAAIYAIAN